jgi:glycosyltransferase involved in cell wall biosynthesis
VGQHLRDFQTLEATVLKIQKHVPGFRLKAVLRKDAARKLPNSPSIEVYSNISDEELRHLYRTSAALLLPLTDTTACNSILEALACGLPIVSNTVGGIEAYVCKDCGFLLNKGDSSGIAEAAISLMENKKANADMRQKCRAQSNKFSWKKAAEEISSFYNSLD